MVCILFNTISLAMFHKDQTTEWIRVYFILEIVFTAVFSIGTLRWFSCLVDVLLFLLASLAPH